MLKEGQAAPMFNLPDETGTPLSLKSLKGKRVLLYFYPKDMTPGCTQEACDFRDNWARLKKKDVVVLGVSADNAGRHTTFRDKYSLPFSLLSDEKKETLKDYGVWAKKKFMGREFMGIVRSTFLIGKDGKIQKIWSPVSVKGHVETVLNELQ